MPDRPRRVSITELERGKPGHYRIAVDDHNLAPGLTSATLVLTGGEAPRLVLELMLPELDPVDVSGAAVIVPERTAAVLAALGWTPPAAEVEAGGEVRDA